MMDNFDKLMVERDARVTGDMNAQFVIAAALASRLTIYRIPQAVEHSRP